MSRIIQLIAGLLVMQVATATDFQITSPDIKEGGTIAEEQVFNGLGCRGGNISPALSWRDAPIGTKSFAVTVFDPDAPRAGGWWHWVVFNIPASAKGLPKNAGTQSGSLPAGSVQSKTDFGKPGYGGPCPPTGDKAHRYLFTVYALKVDKLPLDESVSAAAVSSYLEKNMIAKAVLSAHYGR